MARRYHDFVVDVTPTLDTSAYADEDILFDTTEIANAVLDNGGASKLHSLTIIDKDDNGGAFDLYILRSNTTAGTANAAEAIADDDLDEILTKVSIASGDYVDLANGQIAIKGPTDNGMSALLQASDKETTSLYMFGVSQDTQTYAASGLVFKFGFERA